MNSKIVFTIAAILVVSLATSYAWAWSLPSLDQAFQLNQPFPFEVTLQVLAIDAIPSGDSGDGSYFLIYGLDPKHNNIERIIEIQTNALSVIGNISDLKEVNRDFIYFRTLTHIGETITYECNGFENIDAIEEYPQCYKILSYGQ